MLVRSTATNRRQRNRTPVRFPTGASQGPLQAAGPPAVAASNGRHAFFVQRIGDLAEGQPGLTHRLDLRPKVVVVADGRATDCSTLGASHRQALAGACGDYLAFPLCDRGEDV